MRILNCLIILCLFCPLIAKDEEKTIFSKDKELFIVSDSIGFSCPEDSVTIESDPETKEKYYYWHSVPESIGEDYIYIDTLKTIKVDSVVYVSSKNKSGIFLIKKEKGILCLEKKGNEYIPTYHNWRFNNNSLLNIQVNDINDDKIKEIIIVYGNQFYYNFEIMSFSDESSGFTSLYRRYKILKPEYTTDIIKIRNNRVYFLYKNNNGLSNSYIKYGMIDFYKKDHSDLYFLPISIITPEQWEKL